MISSLSLVLLLVAVASASRVDNSEEAHKVCVDDAHQLLLYSKDLVVEAWLNSMADNIQLAVQYGAHHNLNNEVLAFGDTLKALYASNLNASQYINFIQERTYKKLTIANKVVKRPSICKKNLRLPSWLSCMSVYDALK